MGFSRPLSATERYYLACSEITPDFNIHIIFEGSGPLDLPLWEKAVEEASRANPGSRLVLERHWKFSQWVDSGKTPPVRVADGSSWDGSGPENTPPEITSPLSPRTGPTCEVVLLNGPPARAVFKAHHAVMDGRGVITWAEDVFRALRGEVPFGSGSRLDDFQAARTFQRKRRTIMPHQYCAPTGMPQGEEPGTVWRHARIPGRIWERLPRMAVLLAQAARDSGGDKVRFAFPVDLRRRIEGLRSTGNLTNFIYLDMDPVTGEDDVALSVTRQLRDRTDGLQYWPDQLMRYIPMAILTRSLKAEIAKKNLSGRYRSSGVISNLGSISTQGFQGGGFKTEYVWGIPPGQQIVPIFAGMLASDQSIALVISLPKVLAGQGRLDSLMGRLVQGLCPELPHQSAGDFRED